MTVTDTNTEASGASNDTNRTFDQMNGSGLVAAYNRLVAEATAAGLTGYREVSKFADRTVGLRRCVALQSSLAAHAAGMQAEDRRTEGTYEEIKTSGGLRSEPVPLQVTDTSPGRQRLLASGRAEEIREQVLADQERAAAAAADSHRGAPEVAKKAKKVNGEVRMGRPRSLPYPAETKIRVVNKEPGFREGSVRAQMFEKYAGCRTVGAAIEAGIPGNWIKWHQAQGWVEVG